MLRDIGEPSRKALRCYREQKICTGLTFDGTAEPHLQRVSYASICLCSLVCSRISLNLHRAEPKSRAGPEGQNLQTFQHDLEKPARQTRHLHTCMLCVGKVCTTVIRTISPICVREKLWPFILSKSRRRLCGVLSLVGCWLLLLPAPPHMHSYVILPCTPHYFITIS